MHFAMAATVCLLTACTGGAGDVDPGGPCFPCLSDADLFRPDADHGTMTTPHRVNLDGILFTHQDTTATSTTRAFDAYDCGPTLDQSGSEVWYDVSIDHDVPVRITITHEAEVNVDLYLLVRGEFELETTCLAHGDESIEITIPPGTNQLVVDTPRVDSVESPGSYALEIAPTS